MDSGLKVTDTPEESNFADLVAGDNVINIPLFQREYKWNEKNLTQFWQDIEDILDGTKMSQFLGVVVTVRQPSAIGRPTIYDIVDGQQRLFTCYLSLAAAVRVALDNGHRDWALEVARTYLLLRPFSQHPTNTKLVPSAADRQQFKMIWDEISAHSLLRGEESWTSVGRPVPPQSSGNAKGALLTQYRRVVRKLAAAYKEHGKERIDRTVEILASRLSFVSISLRDPIAAPIIFERLNARGERITTSDLVRNEIFSRVAADPSLAQVIFQNDWQPFQAKFTVNGVDLEKMLFPYGLSIDSSATKAELFSVLRTRWDGFADTRDIISDMERFAPTVILLEKGTALDPLPTTLLPYLKRLHKLGAPSSIYAFVCQLVDSVNREEFDESLASEVLLVIESFLARRAICGIEPTGLHAVFKGLWQDLRAKAGGVTPASIKETIKQKTTVSWPSDSELEEAVRNGDLYNRKICRFVLSSYEGDLQGESPQDEFEIEHILPQAHAAAWRQYFSDEEHDKYRHTFANLIPLTSKMNNVGGRNPFDAKRSAFEDSIFATARAVAREYTEWTPEAIERRATVLADWATNKWPK
ncbi:MAG: DUF262 domain-containing protein [Parvibaculum sp.]|nr:DUF262 domain-containing protein [Parvibaculum sp.]